MNHPDQHLRRINFLLGGMYIACLVVVGVAVWKRTGQWQAVLLLQAAPFLLGDQFRMLPRVSTETVLLIVGLLMAPLLFLAGRADRPAPRMIWALGFLAALGTTTKFNFFPLALVPLFCLQNWRARGAYLLFTGAFTFICLLPLAPHASQVVGFVNGLLFRQGKFGYGEAGILPPEYLSNLLRLLTVNPWLCLAVGASWATFLYGCARWNAKTPQHRRLLLLLGGLALGQTLQMLMVAKYATWHYLVPALVFCPLNLLLMLELWSATFPRMRPMLSAASVIVVLITASNLPSLYGRLLKARDGRMEIVRALQTEFKQEPAAFYYGASSLYYALWSGNYWAGGRYTKSLTAIFRSPPPKYLVHEGSGEVRLMGEKPISFSALSNSHPSFLLIGWGGLAPRIIRFLPPNAKAEQVLVGAGEVIHRVTFE